MNCGLDISDNGDNIVPETILLLPEVGPQQLTTSESLQECVGIRQQSGNVGVARRLLCQHWDDRVSGRMLHQHWEEFLRGSWHDKN